MAFIFCDSFDHITTDDLPGKWDYHDTVTIDTGKHGQGLKFGAMGGSIVKNISAYGYVLLGFYLNVPFLPSQDYTILRFFAGEAVLFGIMLSTDGSLSVTLGFNSYLLTPPGAVTAGEWKYVEIGALIDRLGYVVGGVTGWASYGVYDIDTTSNGDIGVTSVSVSFQDGAVIDDCVIRSDLQFFGPYEVRLLPVSADVLTNWTPSEVSAHYALLDEVPPDLTSYISTSTPEAADSFSVSGLLETDSPYAIQLTARAMGEAYESIPFDLLITTGGQDFTYGPIQPEPSYRYYFLMSEFNPATSGVWAAAEVISSAFGVKAVSQ